MKSLKAVVSTTGDVKPGNQKLKRLKNGGMPT